MKNMLTITLLLFLSNSLYSQNLIGIKENKIEEFLQGYYKYVKYIQSSLSEGESIEKYEVSNGVYTENLEIYISNKKCIKFTSLRSLSCECLKHSIESYDQNMIKIKDNYWITYEKNMTFKIEVVDDTYITIISKFPYIASK